MSDVREFYPTERAIKTVIVELTNFNAVRVDFSDSFAETEDEIRAAMDILVEAVCLIREELGAFRLRKVLQEQEERP